MCIDFTEVLVFFFFLFSFFSMPVVILVRRGCFVLANALILKVFSDEKVMLKSFLGSVHAENQLFKTEALFKYNYVY